MKRHSSLLVLIFNSFFVIAQSTELVYTGFAQSLSPAGGNLYFAAQDPNTYLFHPHLYNTNNQTVVKLSDCICQYNEGSPIFTSTPADVFFMCNDSVHGNELWATKGNAASTRLIKDITPGTESNYNYFSYNVGTVLGNQLIFRGHGNNFAELWSSDGTEAGTELLKDLFPDYPSTSGYPHNFYNVGNKVVFFATKSFNANKSWYMTNGTADSTLQLNNQTFLVQTGQNGIVRNNVLYFSEANNLNGYTIFRADPSKYDPSQPYNGSNSLLLTQANNSFEVMGDFLYFATFKLGKNNMLIKYNMSDFTTDTLLSNLTGLGGLTLVQNKIFFTMSNPDYSQELWVTDGTKAGTMKLISLNNSKNCSFANNSLPFKTYKDRLYFINCDESFGNELWMSNGTLEGTQNITDISQGPANSNFYDFTFLGDYIYISGSSEVPNARIEVLNSVPTIGIWRLKIPKTATGFKKTNYNHPTDDFVFPNPTQDWITIRNTNKGEVEILDLNNRLIKTFDHLQSNTFFVGDLSDGIYFVRLKEAQGIRIKKFIVRRN